MSPVLWCSAHSNSERTKLLKQGRCFLQPIWNTWRTTSVAPSCQLVATAWRASSTRTDPMRNSACCGIAHWNPLASLQLRTLKIPFEKDSITGDHQQTSTYLDTTLMRRVSAGVTDGESGCRCDSSRGGCGQAERSDKNGYWRLQSEWRLWHFGWTCNCNETLSLFHKASAKYHFQMTQDKSPFFQRPLPS